MTWIVGAPTMFGYSFGISDVRVTLGNGDELDCLQKVHPIGRHIAAGFAGSVKIGFAMVDELRRLTDYEDCRMACDPNAVCQQWPTSAQAVFASFEPDEREGQCHLMLFMVHPLHHGDNPSWPLSAVVVFRSPLFQPEVINRSMLGSIGCGTAYEPCHRVVESFAAADFKKQELYMKSEIGTPGGMASSVGSTLTSMLKITQPRAVSAHLHYCWVYRGQTIIKTNNHVHKGSWTVSGLGSGINDPDNFKDNSAELAAMEDGAYHFRMPGLATTWNELVKLLDGNGKDASACMA